MPYVPMPIPVYHGHYHGQPMTPEDLIALTIVFTAIGVPCLVYWLYRTRGIKGFEDKVLEGH